MSESAPSLIERAYQLAGSGRAKTLVELKKLLEREGYTSVASQLTGPSLRSQLRKLMSAGA